MKQRRSDVPFAQVAREVLNDKELSLKAKGLYAYLFGKPLEWDFSSVRIAKELKENRSTICKILTELEIANLLERKKQQDGTMAYLLYTSIKDEFPSVEDSDTAEFPSAEKAHCAESPLCKSSAHNKEIFNKKKEEDKKKEVSLPSGIVKGSDFVPDHTPIVKKVVKRTPTEKQRDAFNAMRSITYYRQKADEAGMDYLKEEDETANKRFQKQAKDFEKRYRANWKDVIDWWFEGEGDWANFHPSNFFNISTYMKFDNHDKGGKKKGGELPWMRSQK